MKRLYSKTLVLAVALLGFSCDSLLDVQPRQSIDAATALTSEEAIVAAMSGVYDRLQNLRIFGRDYIALPEALSDNGRATNKSGRLNAEYLNQPNSHFTNATWQVSYFAINQVNLILDGLGRVNMAQATKDNLEGQALFLRGLLYHNLVRIYAYDPGAIITQNDRGGVLLQLTPIFSTDQIENASRAPVDAVYTQIYADLNAAIPKLNNSRAPLFASRGAAQGLLSRVALTRRDYATAVRVAGEALSSGVGQFVNTASYVGSWRSASNPESMFELQYATAENLGVNESLHTTYSTLLAPGDRSRTGGFGDLVPTANLLAQFEDGDVRRNLYELGTTGRGTAEIECTKFLGRSGQPNLDNVPVLRVAEVILNRAEAYASAGPQQNEALALADLNRIRNRAGLPSVTLTGPALLEEILKQRRVELAFEGDRWFTLKRLGRDIVKAAPAQTLPFIDFRILAPVPVRELQINPNLQQNFGY
jgi:starch-binding outer membrane protein, SusD/RagB family